MQFDATNKIVKRCAQAIDLEGAGKKEEALTLLLQAWSEAKSDFEKFTSAHYIARYQKSVSDKLNWDETALSLALRIKDESVKAVYPSLYLNIGKCYEDLNDFGAAMTNYESALSFTNFLSDDGYGKMIKGGIMNGIERCKHQKFGNE